MDEVAVVRRARQQAGLITRSQAHQLGLSDRMIRGRLDRGSWTALRPGIYVVGAVPGSWEQSVLGACLASGSDAFASHRTGLRLWGFVDRSGPIELLVDGRRRVRVARVQVHRSILFPAVDQTTLRGIPVTTISRTLVDGSAKQDPRTVGQWIDQAMRVHDLDLRELRSCIARIAGPGRRDLRSIRGALALRLPGYDPGDSDFEVRALTAIVAAGLPLPTQQHPVERPDGSTAFIDLAYPELKIAIELEGWEAHGTRAAFDPDRARRNDLTVQGWSVLQFTWAMTDAQIVATVRAAIEGHR